LELVTGRGARRQHLDLEITSQKPGTHGETARALGLTADALYASEAYLLDHGRPSRPGRLEGHRVVLLGGGLARTDAGRWLQDATRNGAQVALRTDSYPVFFSAVHAGVGLGVLARGAEELAPELVRVGELPELPPRTLWLVFRGDGRPSPRARRAAQA